MKTIADLKANAVAQEGTATIQVNGNVYRAELVNGKVFVSFNGARMAADKAQNVLDFDNHAVETKCDVPNVVSTADQLKNLAPGAYTVVGEASGLLSERQAEAIQTSMKGGDWQIIAVDEAKDIEPLTLPVSLGPKVNIRGNDLRAAKNRHAYFVRLVNELNRLRKRHGIVPIRTIDGGQWHTDRRIRPAVRKKIAKLKRLIDFALKGTAYPVFVYEVENVGRPYGFTDNWIRKPQFNDWCFK